MLAAISSASPLSGITPNYYSPRTHSNAVTALAHPSWPVTGEERAGAGGARVPAQPPCPPRAPSPGGIPALASLPPLLRDALPAGSGCCCCGPVGPPRTKLQASFSLENFLKLAEGNLFTCSWHSALKHSGQRSGRAGPGRAAAPLHRGPRSPGAVDAGAAALAHRVEHGAGPRDKAGVAEHGHDPAQHRGPAAIRAPAPPPLRLRAPGSAYGPPARPEYRHIPRHGALCGGASFFGWFCSLPPPIMVF